LKRQDQRISKTCKALSYSAVHEISERGPIFAFSGMHPCPPVSYATAHSRKVLPLKPRVKAKSSLSGRNYFETMHHQARVNFENFTEVKIRDILPTGMGHRDSPGQTYGRSNLNQNL